MTAGDTVAAATIVISGDRGGSRRPGHRSSERSPPFPPAATPNHHAINRLSKEQPVSERRIGKALACVGAPLTLAGVAMYFLPGPGFPVLVIGLALLMTGLAMIAASRYATHPVRSATEGTTIVTRAGEDEHPAAQQPRANETAQERGHQTPPQPRPLSVTAEYDGLEPIARARELARSFLADLHHVHGLPISGRVQELVELVVSELVTNARQYAPGPRLLTLQVRDDCLDVAVWDSNPDPPTILPPDPTRVGEHGLEIIMAAARTLQIHREPVGKRITAAIALTHKDPDEPGRQPTHP